MKLLLVGNHTCGNRGDAAILRGLIAEIRNQRPDVEIDIYSRFPVSSSFLLNEQLQIDPLDKYHNSVHGFKDQIWKKFSRRFLGYQLANKLKKSNLNNVPEHIKKHITHIKNYDAVIQVGGSFFVDLYGPAQFEHALCALLADKKLFLLGHSVGPFESKKYSKLANQVFSLVDELALREALSLDYMRKAAISDERVTKGADTAWVVPNTPVPIMQHLEKQVKNKPTIAITMRKLAPFDKRLGVTQLEYENKLAELIDNLNELGYRVVIASTCTGIDSYQRDDRMTALQVQEKVKNKDACYVIMDELNDIELGSLLSMCTITIGTRFHSSIICMNFGTPAIAINYEHKSQGIMAQLNMPELSKEVSSLFNGELLSAAEAILANLDDVKQRMQTQVELERQRARNMVQRVLDRVASD